MYQVISTVAVLSTVVAILIHFVVAGRKGPDLAGDTDVMRRMGLWARLVHLGIGFGFLGAAVTGFQAAMVEEALTGIWLLVHFVFGATFMGALAAAALTWADGHRFEKHDAEWFAAGGWIRPEAGVPAGRFDLMDKLFFWTAMVAGLSAVLPILLSMLPIFGPEGIAVLEHVHAYAGLALLLAVLWHMYRAMVVKSGALSVLVTGMVGVRWARAHHAIWVKRVRRDRIDVG